MGTSGLLDIRLYLGSPEKQNRKEVNLAMASGSWKEVRKIDGLGGWVGGWMDERKRR